MNFVRFLKHFFYRTPPTDCFYKQESLPQKVIFTGNIAVFINSCFHFSFEFVPIKLLIVSADDVFRNHFANVVFRTVITILRKSERHVIMVTVI